MTRQEFTKFIKNLDKSDLINIVLDLTKRKKDLQEKIVLEYSTDDNLSIAPDEVLEKFNDLNKQLFTKRYTYLDSKTIGQYCKAANKIISNYVEPLIKKKEFYNAAYLLQEIFYRVYDELGSSLYKYDSRRSFFNKVKKDFDKIITGASLLDKVKISNLMEDNLYRDLREPLFNFCLERIYLDHFNDPEWDEKKKKVLEDNLNSFLEAMDYNKPASDEFSALALKLLKLYIKNELPQKEIDAYIEKYKFLGDIIHFQASSFVDQGDYKKAIALLKETENLPTLSQKQLQANSDLFINILEKENSIKGDNQNRAELLKELKKNLDNFHQNNPDNLLTYFFHIDNDLMDNIYEGYKTNPTTKDLFTSDSIKQSFTVLKALKNRDYKELNNWEDSFVVTFAKYEPSLVGNYIVSQVKAIMAEKTSDKNYRLTEEKLKLLWSNPLLRDFYENCKADLIEKYPNRSRTHRVFNTVENSLYFFNLDRI